MTTLDKQIEIERQRDETSLAFQYLTEAQEYGNADGDYGRPVCTLEHVVIWIIRSFNLRCEPTAGANVTRLFKAYGLANDYSERREACDRYYRIHKRNSPELNYVSLADAETLMQRVITTDTEPFFKTICEIR